MKRFVFAVIGLLGMLFTNESDAQNFIPDNGITPKYEMRAAWVASVANIDWPSRKGLSVAQQKNEYIAIVEKAKQIGLNALFVQIRPATDAFYHSQYDPWSEYITGKQGQHPGYDPLQFMLEETHKRGMEFHAWLNPYRAVVDVRRSSVDPNHITRRRPDLFFTYGTGKIFDPGIPETRQYFVGVVKDIINRYEVDGIHIDDYFYPYKIAGKDYPDDASFRKYGNGMTKANWRRNNVDLIIKEIHEAILSTKPMVRFGVSPFGIYRNKSEWSGGSDTRGTTNYNDLFADILRWSREGWVDYVVPQLYWPIGKDGQDFRILTDWWAKNSYGRQLYIGQGFFNANSTALWRNKHELPNQIKYMRRNDNVHGSVYFSFKSIQNNLSGWSDSLRNNYYRKPAIVPPMAWIDKTPAFSPEVWTSTSANNYDIKISGALNELSKRDRVKSYVLYYTPDFSDLGNAPEQILTANGANRFEFSVPLNKIPNNWNKFFAVVTTLDRENNESEPSNIIRFEKISGRWVGYNGH